MFKEYLLSAQTNNIPISIYTDKTDTEKFSFGFIQGISNDYVLLASISPFGFYDGFTIKSYMDIYRCESKDRYGEKVYKLYQIHKQSHPNVDLLSDNLILDLIQYAYNNHLVISAEVHTSDLNDVQGFVSSIHNGLICVDQIDSDGYNNGESMLLIEEITCVTCDSDCEMALRLLADNQ